jgi:hypothetical protein
MCEGLKKDKALYPKELSASLDAHYQQITRYRAGAMHKAVLATDNPGDFISISQDGTDQMGFGYPKSADISQKEDNPKIKAKIMISMVHGSGVY